MHHKIPFVFYNLLFFAHYMCAEHVHQSVPYWKKRFFAQLSSQQKFTSFCYKSKLFQGQQLNGFLFGQLLLKNPIEVERWLEKLPTFCKPHVL